MAGTRGAKPRDVPAEPHEADHRRHPLVRGQWIWSPLKQAWLVLKPEELIRQSMVLVLWDAYGYQFEQMDQERRTQAGRKSPKADIIVWESEVAKRANQAPVLVVECKGENVTIVPVDYDQGESYARATGAEFLVAHNGKETRFFRLVPGVPGTREDIEDIPSLGDLPNAARMDQLRRATKAFAQGEFRRLLADSHSVLRDNHKLEPGKAFDEISKILFIKMFIERTGDFEKFSVDYLDRYAALRRRRAEEVMDDLFEDTKRHYDADELFAADDQLNISFATFRRIVEMLQRFNLAATSEDVKGVAFERFLGQTFRGQLGQFFTPRPIVDFMVAVADPREGEVVCDPASGSGGFLIAAFDHIRHQIEEDVQRQKDTARQEIEARGLPEEDESELINTAFVGLTSDIDPAVEGGRLWSVAHDSILGSDAEPRAARTSKMNMIMHGDGHGGIHHHDGLIDTNGIFEGRCDVILTNPPFGASVKDDQVVGSTRETTVTVSAAEHARRVAQYGPSYDASYQRMKAAEDNNRPILSLFTLGADEKNVKTELLFLERCISLLKEEGRLAIVVPDGTLNNPSLTHVRHFVEQRASIEAVVSIPDKTFRSAKTAAKASLLFLRKLTADEVDARRRTYDDAHQAVQLEDQDEVEELEQLNQTTLTRYRRAVRENQSTAARTRGGDALDADGLTDLKRASREQLKILLRRPAEVARAAVREVHDYDVFMAVAEHVGVRASGKPDPLNDLPAILDAWRAFRADPANIQDDVRLAQFRIRWSRLDRWDPSSYRPIEWACAAELLAPLGTALTKLSDKVDRGEVDFTEVTPITIHFDGSIEPRDMEDVDDYTMDLYRAPPGSLVVSKIDLKNGAVGIIPADIESAVVTNHFVVYEIDKSKVYPPYLIRMIQTEFFRAFLWRKKVGTEGRKEVKIPLFEGTEIPMPDVNLQKELVKRWTELETDATAIGLQMRDEREQLNDRLLKGGG